MAKRRKSAHIVLDAKKLRVLRQKAVLSQEDLALKADVSTKTVERLESGQPCYPDTLGRVAAALNVAPEALLPEGEVPSRKSVSSGSLPPFPRLFVGRESDIERIRRKLVGQVEASSDDHRMTVVHGWPGVGKTTLTAAIAHDSVTREAFPDGVLWASLGQNPRLEEVLQQWAIDLGVDETVTGIKELTRKLTAFMWDRQMLVIVDDVWDAQHFVPLDVAGSKCAILVTSRHPRIGNELAPRATDILQLDCLSEDESLHLLTKVAGDELVQEFLVECERLVADLEGLPLGLHVAGCWLRSTASKGWDLSGEFAELRDLASLLESTAPANMAAFLTESTNITIAALLKKSTDCLTATSQYRFATLGAYPAKPAKFPVSMISRAWETDAKETRDTVGEFLDLGLMERTDDETMWIHSLLAAFARTLWTEEQ